MVSGERWHAATAAAPAAAVCWPSSLTTLASLLDCQALYVRCLVQQNMPRI